MDQMAKARIAVVGCGGWTQYMHLPNLSRRTNAEISALVDPFEKPGVGGLFGEKWLPMEELAEKYATKWFKNLDDLFSDAQTPIDGVIICTPHTLHASLGEQALQAGKHILVEKPMAADMQDALRLVAASEANPNQAFIVNNSANWAVSTIAAFDAVQGGRIGEVRHVNALFASPTGWLFEGKDYGVYNQTTSNMSGNGYGWAQLTHTFAWIYKVTGLTPKKVYAVCSYSETTGADIIDSISITCTSNATITCSGVGTIPDHGFKVMGKWLFGTEGMLQYQSLTSEAKAYSGEHGSKDESNIPKMQIWRHDGQTETGPEIDFEYLDAEGDGPGSLDALICACLGQPYLNMAGAYESLKTVATIDAMYKSGISGQPVDVVLE